MEMIAPAGPAYYAGALSGNLALRAGIEAEGVVPPWGGDGLKSVTREIAAGLSPLRRCRAVPL
jgi:hypothetical protein